MNDNENPFYDQKIQKILNKLISEEWLAGNMYRFYVQACDPEYRGMILETFMKASEDELNEHMKDMIDWAMKYGYSVPSSIKDIERYASDEAWKQFTVYKKDGDSKYYVDKAILAEYDAIDSYKEAMQEDVLQRYGDLQTIIVRNYYDEMEHLQDLGSINYMNLITKNIKDNNNI